ncbi:LytR/AlgR family response regulator transcription factor [Pseudobacter ginsenosidimutans]|uniref:LytTR family two component transcriptional regulator n=1 Tax=Pseudobacter ginsenosidimutans TaxID=661488 RepID=A0A4Q7MCV8_9BACT|nr:LytTR family DNA-binding domain-containing protein [Pseudobacter ginsenosidimutans]QEC42686.1 response regulator transcription factor [Pseudobacter ginsenosidimutans]RZS65163.1 LytTR family two component transcriptional regulator [Pseudobacter ginsenosidimutans]
MLSAIIIDDEVKGRIALKKKLQDYCPEVTVTGEAADGLQGIALISQLQPQIVFLDIEMPRMDGFAMLQQLSEKKFHLVFTTAYDQYAIRAIRFAAFDYLLKPVDIEELRNTISKILQSHGKPETGRKLEVLADNLQRNAALNKIAIPTLEGLLFFNVDDIIHLEAHSNYTVIHFTNHAKLTASRTLKEFEELLPNDKFFRPHHSHLINLTYLKRYIKGDGGQIEMQNGNYVDVARRKKEEFLQRMLANK